MSQPSPPTLPPSTCRPCRRAILLAGLLLLTALPGAALPDDDEEWLAVETAHFRLISNAGERKTAEIGRELERFRQVLGLLAPDLRLDPPAPTLIFVFDDERSFAPYKRWRGRADDSLLGYFLSHNHGSYIALNAYPRRGSSLAVIFHEYVHAFVRYNFPGIPVWANEGLAEYYATFGDLGSDVQIGGPQVDHVGWLRRRSFIPFDRLFAIDTASAEYNEREKKGVFYAQSWALMHYLLSEPELRSKAGELLSRLDSGTPSAEAVESVYGLSTGELESKLRGYVNRREMSVLTLSADQLAAPGDQRVARLDRATALALLGELLVHSEADQAPAARDHFEAALAVAPRHPVALTGLACIALHGGDPAAARQPAQAAVESGSAHPLSHLAAGEAPLDQLRLSGLSGEEAEMSGLWRVARGHLEKALELAPEFAEARALLGTTYLYDPAGPDGGLPHLERALTELPGRDDIAFNLTMLHVKAGRYAAAAQLIELTLEDGDPEMAAQAREVVERNRLIDESNRALSAGESARALALYRQAVELTTDRAVAAQMRRELERLEGTAAANRLIERYNRAVELANGGSFEQAAQLLRELLDEIEDPDLLTRAERLLRDIERVLR